MSDIWLVFRSGQYKASFFSQERSQEYIQAHLDADGHNKATLWQVYEAQHHPVRIFEEPVPTYTVEVT